MGLLVMCHKCSYEVGQQLNFFSFFLRPLCIRFIRLSYVPHKFPYDLYNLREQKLEITIFFHGKMKEESVWTMAKIMNQIHFKHFPYMIAEKKSQKNCWINKKRKKSQASKVPNQWINQISRKCFDSCGVYGLTSPSHPNNMHRTTEFNREKFLLCFTLSFSVAFHGKLHHTNCKMYGMCICIYIRSAPSFTQFVLNTNSDTVSSLYDDLYAFL